MHRELLDASGNYAHGDHSLVIEGSGVSRAEELEQAVANMHASAASIRASIAEMVEILRATRPEDRSLGLRESWREMVAELSSAAKVASQALQDN